MDTDQPSIARDVVGFILGGMLAAIAAGGVFVACVPLPEGQDPRNHVREAFLVTVLVLWFCGGFIGRCGFSAEALSELFPSVIGTFVTVVMLALIADLDLDELAPFVGFALAGVVASAAGSLLLRKWFPPPPQCET